MWQFRVISAKIGANFEQQWAKKVVAGLTKDELKTLSCLLNKIIENVIRKEESD